MPIVYGTWLSSQKMGLKGSNLKKEKFNGKGNTFVVRKNYFKLTLKGKKPGWSESEDWEASRTNTINLLV